MLWRCWNSLEWKLMKDEDGINKTYYKQVIGSLNYLTTRPDIMFVASLISRYMENPTSFIYPHQNTLFEGNARNFLYFVAYTVIMWNLDERKSTSGYVFLLSSGAVLWSSKKQPIVSLSAASCACHAVWLKGCWKSCQNQDKSTIIHYDSSSAIKLSKNLVMHGRSWCIVAHRTR